MKEEFNPIAVFDRVGSMSFAERRVVYAEEAVTEAQQAQIESWIAEQTSSPQLVVDQVNLPDQQPPPPSRMIGPYVLGEVLGKGGMGIVYKAEQHKPFHRQVALKVIKLGMDSEEVIARFESEREALARMDHPGIARIYDGGTDDRGRPYFAMEYVPGIHITTFCDTNKLPIRDRLELFIGVCDAVAHAHTKGIIHRDIKPSNVLAYTDPGGKRVVKIIDFGIARAVSGDRLLDRTNLSSPGQIIASPLTMSPEQTDGGRNIDTLTDVYLLGALLYELLVGDIPLGRMRLEAADDSERRRIIREQEPQRPSTRVFQMKDAAAAIAEYRNSSASKLIRDLRGELEWIPMMALRKARADRYAGPLKMAEDIRNFLSNRAVAAAPESSLYRVRKYVHRNWVRLATVFTVVVAFAFVALLYARDRQRRAENDIKNADLLKEQDFISQIISAQSPFANESRRAQSSTAVVDVAADNFGTYFPVRDNAYAQVSGIIADNYIAAGKYQHALPFAKKSFDTYYRLNSNGRETANAFHRYLAALMQAEDVSNAAKLLESCGGLVWLRNILGKTDPSVVDTARLSAVLLQLEGHPGQAESLLKVLLSEQTNQRLRLDVKSFLAHLYAREFEKHGSPSDIAKAITIYREIVEEARTLPEEKYGMLGAWISLLGQQLFAEGTPDDLHEAERLIVESLRLREEGLAPDHIEINNSLIPLARLLDWEGRTKEAEQHWKHALGIAQTADVMERQRWTCFARYAESLKAHGRTGEEDDLLSNEEATVAKAAGDPAVIKVMRDWWKEVWDTDQKADAFRQRWR